LIQQFSFGVQQELIHNLLLDVAYVGNLGKRLQAFQNLNPNTYSYNSVGAPVTGARVLSAAGFNNDIQYADSSGISNYNSLQARVERRFAAGFTMLASYTYGKALTDSVDHLATSGTGNGSTWVHSASRRTGPSPPKRIRSSGVRCQASLHQLRGMANSTDVTEDRHILQQGDAIRPGQLGVLRPF
jgi:hypothetical protein